MRGEARGLAQCVCQDPWMEDPWMVFGVRHTLLTCSVLCLAAPAPDCAADRLHSLLHTKPLLSPIDCWPEHPSPNDLA